MPPSPPQHVRKGLARPARRADESMLARDGQLDGQWNKVNT